MRRVFRRVMVVDAPECSPIVHGKKVLLRVRGARQRAEVCWMGNWIFVRSHPLYAGLPVNCAMKGDYQVPFFNADGLLLGGDNVEVAAAYSLDHDRNIGAKGKARFFLEFSVISIFGPKKYHACCQIMPLVA